MKSPKTSGIAQYRLANGRRGEEIASEWLTERGFQIVGTNVRVGRSELDIIAERGSLVVICEVRTRSAGGFGAVGSRAAGAEDFWLIFTPWRFHSLAVTMSQKSSAPQHRGLVS